MSMKQAHKRSQFSKHEDHKLRELVKVYGENNWCLIAKMMNSRNPRQCRDRYKNYLSPLVNSSPWSYEEEVQLDMLVQYFGKRWSILSKFFAGRTEINLKCHYSMIERRRKRAMAIYEKQPTFVQNTKDDFDDLLDNMFCDFGEAFDF